MSNAQENATAVTPETFDVPKTLEILSGFLTDNGSLPLKLKRTDFTIAGETDTGATFVSHVSISPAESFGYSSWNDFEYYKEVAESIQEKGTCPECEMPIELEEVESV